MTAWDIDTLDVDCAFAYSPFLLCAEWGLEQVRTSAPMARRLVDS